jgi:hypothetical protein
LFVRGSLLVPTFCVGMSLSVLRGIVVAHARLRHHLSPSLAKVAYSSVAQDEFDCV